MENMTAQIVTEKQDVVRFTSDLIVMTVNVCLVLIHLWFFNDTNKKIQVCINALQT